jgi:uncharacterized protein YggE
MENGKQKNYLVIAGIVIGIILISSLIFQLTGSIRSGFVSSPGTQGITVNGEGSISVKPDMARVTLGMEAVAATAKEAQRKNTAAMNQIVSTLKNLGLAAKDIQTTDFSLFPERRYDKVSGQDRVVGYRAANQVTVIVRDLDKLGPAIDQSIQAGANNVQNISFTVESPEKWREQAIAKAVKEARNKAEALAKAAGMRIKRIVAMNESTIDVRPYLMDQGFKKAEVLGAGDAVNPVIEPGSVKVTANVQMNFGI